MEGFGLVLIIVLGVLFVIFATAKFNLHPFLSLLISAFAIGILSGMPLNEVVEAVNGGFGGLMGGIGLVIVFGTIIGVILENSGAALRMAEVVLRIVGEKRPQLAMSAIGSIVSIPVFCDSGYVILSSLKKALANKTKVTVASMAIALSTGLFATHTLVPPTPGPIAAAGNIGAQNYLGTVILFGIIVAVPAILMGYIWAIKAGQNIHISNKEDDHLYDYDEVVSSFGDMPSATKSFAPILVPILLIAFSSIITFAGWEGAIFSFFLFLGSPVVALLVGVLIAFTLLPKYDEETLTKWVGIGIKESAPILLITGAGGAFGSVISSTSIADLIKGIAGNEVAIGAVFIFIPFIIAAALKSAQGSSTAAIVITSTLIAPLLPQIGIEGAVPLSLVVMAVGAGAMVVSHVNDSYFWVVKEFSGMSITQAYKAQTMGTLLQGLTAIVVTSILWFILV
ncbi:predicted D-glycerate permease [Halobacillus karajensis]|uniref:DsdX permease n=1 Tax=Halobacillus karajensis TaxID=195088 RepID=A0A024P362_9BACI|nr:GntP family permease [Halobacillus karajensis]CDQ19137.1 DsdX permease [Halobacillus karajensis]CDQ22789.1 DsdX permease [Halobacillus karajensis]CDQ26271.1 DsdX permease [Halobacillus karajensis]SEH41055.1 predicted D-glycerate permease [Halobacillus karajensis]